MGRFSDFNIFNTENMSGEELTKAMFDSLFVHRVKANKPCIIMLVGDSGEGKSYDALRIGEIVGEIQGFDFSQVVEDCIIHHPLEYPTKMKRLFEAPELKKVNLIIIDEAREVVKASQWYSFANQAISDINSTSRALKPMIIIIIAQFVKDVDPKIRRTIQYYGNCYRPMNDKAKMVLYRLYKDDRQIEKPMVRKRRVRGFFVNRGRYIPFRPKEFVFNLPKKETIEKYEKNSQEAKGVLIKYKLNQLMAEMQKEYKGLYSRVEAAVEFCLQNPQTLETITKRSRGKIKIKPEVQKMYGFDEDELAEFEKRIIEGMKTFNAGSITDAV